MQTPRSKVQMMTTARIENHARFMGFRDCPVCGETLFAAEHAEFVCADHMILRWRCDACDHSFQTTAAVARGAPLHVA
jgi:ribosomal protein S27AE